MSTGSVVQQQQQQQQASSSSALSVSAASKFSAESPPFNPNNIMGIVNNNRTSPNHSRNNSYIFGNSNGNGMNALAQQQQQQQGTGSTNGNIPGNSNAIMKYTFPNPDPNGTNKNELFEIRNVWEENVESEMKYIREVVETYPYVAMDTEFPGIVAKPIITESFSYDYHYKSLKVNVDLLKIIQLGLCFANEEGTLYHVIWQFNFHFDLDDDMFAQDSIDLLIKSGISFQDHKVRGIEPQLFGELLMVSGLVLDDRVKWISFHSGYDYGYLLKLLTTVELPNDEKNFFDLLRIYFPIIYDIKYMTSLLDGYQYMGGLQRLADDLKCTRIGTEHQAGSDSLLTMSTYFALVKAKFNSNKNNELNKCTNELFGYGNNHTVRKTAGGGGANLVVRDVSTGGSSVLSSGSND